MDDRDLISQLILEVFLLLVASSESDEHGDSTETDRGGWRGEMGGASNSEACGSVLTGRKVGFMSYTGEVVDFDASHKESQDKESARSSGDPTLTCSPEREDVKRREGEAGGPVIVEDSVEGSGPDSLTTGSFSRQMSINSPSPGESSKSVGIVHLPGF